MDEARIETLKNEICQLARERLENGRGLSHEFLFTYYVEAGILTPQELLDLMIRLTTSQRLKKTPDGRIIPPEVDASTLPVYGIKSALTDRIAAMKLRKLI